MIKNQPLDSHPRRGGSQVKNAVKLLGRRNEREAALQSPRSEQKEVRRCSRHREEIPMVQQGRERRWRSIRDKALSTDHSPHSMFLCSAWRGEGRRGWMGRKCFSLLLVLIILLLLIGNKIYLPRAEFVLPVMVDSESSLYTYFDPRELCHLIFLLLLRRGSERADE